MENYRQLRIGRLSICYQPWFHVPSCGLRPPLDLLHCHAFAIPRRIGPPLLHFNRRLDNAAADCGRLSICYIRWKVIRAKLRIAAASRTFLATACPHKTAADCGRLSICYIRKGERSPEALGCGLRPPLDLLHLSLDRGSRSGQAADCGRLSICYIIRRWIPAPLCAADCGRLSICYIPATACPHKLRIAAASRFATFFRRSFSSRSWLRIAAASRTLSARMAHAADCGRLSICYISATRQHSSCVCCGLRPPLDLLHFDSMKGDHAMSLRCGLRPPLDLLHLCARHRSCRTAGIRRGFATLRRNAVHCWNGCGLRPPLDLLHSERTARAQGTGCGLRPPLDLLHLPMT